MPPATRQIVSTAHGPLRRLLLYFPREAMVRSGYRVVYADLLGKLPAATRLTVVAHPGAVDALDQLLHESGRRATTTVIRSDLDLRFTVWAQDPCVVVQGNDEQTTFVTPARFDREQDADAVELLARATSADVQRSSLSFPGGDVLAGDDFVLLGWDCRRATMDAPEHEAAAAASTETYRAASAARCFQELFAPDHRVRFVGTDRLLSHARTRPIEVKGREVVEILPGGGEGPHPLVHLDMFMTLAGRGADGRYRLLVGSPALADELLGRDVVDPELSAACDDVAAQLLAEGFEVERNPLPLTFGDGRRRLDGEVRDVRLWYLATANNCLVQIDEVAGDHVWLPTYGHGAWRELTATDAVNRRIWEQLGFTVHELTSFHTFTQRFGALHCIAKELDRRPLGPADRGGK